jgi:hypothetical protein
MGPSAQFQRELCGWLGEVSSLDLGTAETNLPSFAE